MMKESPLSVNSAVRSGSAGELENCFWKRYRPGNVTITDSQYRFKMKDSIKRAFSNSLKDY